MKINGNNFLKKSYKNSFQLEIITYLTYIQKATSSLLYSARYSITKWASVFKKIFLKILGILSGSFTVLGLKLCCV